MCLSAISRRYRSAAQCRYCFDAGFVLDGQVKLAQPRWIGPDYFTSKPRILVVLINPGDVTCGDDFEALISDFEVGDKNLPDLLRYIDADMPLWSDGKYEEFYFEQLKLLRRSTAFINIALCGAKGNEGKNAYPDKMLCECFGRHSSRLIRTFAPDILLLSGQQTHQFANCVRELVPNCRIKTIPHYRSRKTADVIKDDVKKNRRWIRDCQRKYRNCPSEL